MSATGAIAGAVADQLLGEPPVAWHPVARYGSLMERVEQRTYADTKRAGVAHLAVGLGLGAAVGLGLRRAIGPLGATAVATTVCTAGRMLDDEALAVARQLERGDLDGARIRLKSLVGRDTGALDAGEISRAAIESVAENCVDAVTAPILWAAVGGAPAVLAHRAINTLDAMVGYRSDRYREFGWSSARLDDIVNYVPAQVTVLAVVAVRPRRAQAIRTAIRRDAPDHPSPNGGRVEAAFAAALGVQLGGVNRYGDAVEDRGTLGDGRPAQPGDIARAVGLRRECTAAVAAAVGLGSLARRRGHGPRDWADRASAGARP